MNFFSDKAKSLRAESEPELKDRIRLQEILDTISPEILQAKIMEKCEALSADTD